MKHHKPGWSMGTILTLLLTVTVTAGCLFMFSRMRGETANAQMDAQRVIGLMSSALQGPTAAPTAQQNQVRTVKVTLAPTAASPVADTPAPALTATPVPAKPTAALPPYTFSLTAGGLLSFHSEISDSVYSKTDKTADYRPVLAQISGKVYADLNLVTLPQLLNATDRKYGDAIALSEGADAVRTLGMDQVILGSEHILDQGAQGAADTVNALTARGLTCTGVNISGAVQRRLIPLNGGEVALLSYTDALTAKSKTAQKGNAGLLQPFSLDAARADIRWARSQGARCVIVCMYWSNPNADEKKLPKLRETAQALAQMGADIILGTRPSRVLPMEIISVTGEDGKARDAFVAYSLGTLLTESREGYDISGVLLHLTVSSDGQGRMQFEAEYTPTYIWRQSVNGATQYRVVCSADPAPNEMSSQQKQVMQRALARVQSTLENCPVTQRP